MRPKASFRRTVVFSSLLILAACLSPAPAAAEESAINAKQTAGASA